MSKKSIKQRVLDKIKATPQLSATAGGLKFLWNDMRSWCVTAFQERVRLPKRS